MEEMQTKEKQIVYDQALYEKAYEFAKKKHGTQILHVCPSCARFCHR